MAELFMECEEEELEPWQRRMPEVVDDDDDDDEPIFIGEITSSKASTTSRQSPGPTFKATNQHYTTPASPPSVMAVYQPVSRSVGASVTSQPAPRPSPTPSSAAVCRSISGPIVPQVAVRPMSPASQPVTRSLLIPVTTQPVDRAGPIPIVTQHMSRNVTAVTAQPIIINSQAYIMSSSQISNNSTLMLGLKSGSGGNNNIITTYPGATSITVLPGITTQFGRPVQQLTQVHQVTPVRTVSNAGVRPQLQVPSTVQNNIVSIANVQSSSLPVSTKLQSPQMNPAKLQPIQMSTATLQPIQMSSTALQATPVSSPKQPPLPVISPKLQNTPVAVNRTGNGTNSVAKRPVSSDTNSTTPKKAKLDSGTPSTASGSVKNGTPFLKACPKCNVHFNLPDPLRNHMRYCCYEMLNVYFPTTSKQGTTTTQVKAADTEKGKLIMLVKEFYYGKHEGELGEKDVKTNPTFKCCSCLKILKNNIRFMNHMKHHLELEKQSNESWENHTTCQHCYRQYSTPFQLQCHIESAHSPYESTTNCKICELAFESEQVLLQHMKDNHKPGEMPYVCQVCSYRSSFFSDVENHFRSVHENTKYLLCPFCLKVIRSGTPYMQHYMRHQKKGIHRCTKCRLQFLTCKEKMDHKTQHHRTFKKPKSLEGLPPGTKVTIRASLASSGSPASPNSSSRSIVSIVPSSPNAKQSSRPQSSQGKPKSASQNKKQERLNNSKQLDRCNLALRNLRNHLGAQKCIECYSEIKDFSAHYPSFVSCVLCKYRTSCCKAYGNHMIRFHSASSRGRLRKRKKPSGSLRGITLVCLNCDFLTDASGADNMSKHLTDRQNHTCQVIIEKDASEVCIGEERKPEPQDNPRDKETDESQKSKCPSDVIKDSANPLDIERKETKMDDPVDGGDTETHGDGPKAVSGGGGAPKDTSEGEADNLSSTGSGSEAKTEPSAASQAKDQAQGPEQGEQSPTSGTAAPRENLNKNDASSDSAKPLPSPTAGDGEGVESEKKEARDVSFEQFLRKVDVPESISSDESPADMSFLVSS
ncbi:zinc finger protein 280C isoform X2 [Amia ocellicauda]|uniref:zinc finger protein 280C isoform X2 n=1 Tax=Amia ocellicauda TaxID=2972642 RepID=UPI003464129C